MNDNDIDNVFFSISVSLMASFGLLTIAGIAVIAIVSIFPV